MLSPFYAMVLSDGASTIIRGDLTIIRGAEDIALAIPGKGKVCLFLPRSKGFPFPSID